MFNIYIKRPILGKRGTLRHGREVRMAREKGEPRHRWRKCQRRKPLARYLPGFSFSEPLNYTDRRQISTRRERVHLYVHHTHAGLLSDESLKGVVKIWGLIPNLVNKRMESGRKVPYEKNQ